MKREIILFDWDDTLFSKNKFKDNLNRCLAVFYGKSFEEMSELMDEYVNGLKYSDDFRIDDFIIFLGKKTGKEIDVEKFKNDDLKIYSGSLFEDTITVLTELKKRYILGIYSQGFDDIQNIKIKSSGLRDFFDDQYMYIGRDKVNLDFVKKLPKNSTIVDDKKEVIGILNSLSRFNVIWINRNDDTQMGGVKTIRCLNELI